MPRSLIFLASLLLACLFTQPLSAQLDNGQNPLFTQLQKNTDSTIVYEYATNWISTPNLYILSKKSDTLNAFTYRNLAANHHSLGIIPGVRSEMRKENRHKILTAKIEMNEFFHYHPLRKKDIIEFWSELRALRPWSLTDDAVNGEGCPVVTARANEKGHALPENQVIYDGGGLRIYLITKDTIKVLNYYAPDFYIKICPGRKDREAAMEISSIFYKFIL